MIDLYFWSTPNGSKITIHPEQLGWSHNVRPSISARELFAAAFAAILPTNKILFSRQPTPGEQ